MREKGKAPTLGEWERQDRRDGSEGTFCNLLPNKPRGPRTNHQ